MSIKRSYRKSGVTIIPTSTMDDTSLSYKALGLLCYLISRPDGWNVTYKGLMKSTDRQGRDGERSVLSGLKELRLAGYYKHDTERDKQGKYVHITIISDVPVPQWARDALEFDQVEPNLRFRDPDKPDSGNVDC